MNLARLILFVLPLVPVSALQAHAWAPGSGFADNAIWPIANTDITSMQDTFGPRVQSGDTFDFHRGIDIPTPQNTPVRAILAGKVKKIAQSSSEGHTQYRVEIEHTKTNGDKYRSVYSHLNSYNLALREGDQIAQGVQVGLSGYDSSVSFPHLHFEIRDLGGYKKHAVHPLRVLPYDLLTEPTVSMSVDTSGSWQVHAQVTLPAEQQDLTKIELLVFDGNGVPVPQNQWTTTYDFELFNSTFTHLSNEWNNSSCPFFSAHQGAHDEEFHLGDADFNTVLVEPEHFGGSSTEQTLHFTFTSFTLPAVLTNTTIVVRAWNIQGQYEEAIWSYPG